MLQLRSFGYDDVIPESFLPNLLCFIEYLNARSKPTVSGECEMREQEGEVRDLDRLVGLKVMEC